MRCCGLLTAARPRSLTCARPDTRAYRGSFRPAGRTMLPPTVGPAGAVSSAREGLRWSARGRLSPLSNARVITLVPKRNCARYPATSNDGRARSRPHHSHRPIKCPVWSKMGPTGHRLAVTRFLRLPRQYVQIRRPAATAAPTLPVGKVSFGCQFPDQPAHLADRAAARGSKIVLRHGSACASLVNGARDGEKELLLAPHQLLFARPCSSPSAHRLRQFRVRYRGTRAALRPLPMSRDRAWRRSIWGCHLLLRSLRRSSRSQRLKGPPLSWD